MYVHVCTIHVPGGGASVMISARGWCGLALVGWAPGSWGGRDCGLRAAGGGVWVEFIPPWIGDLPMPAQKKLFTVSQSSAATFFFGFLVLFVKCDGISGHASALPLTYITRLS